MAKKKTTHKKPTEKDIEKTLQEAEELKGKPDEGEPEPEPSPKPPKEEPEPEEEEKETPEPEEEPEPEKKEEPKPPEKPDLKKKLSASARENQKILAKNRRINEAIDKADEIPEPTDDEMRVLYPNWDEMEEREKGHRIETEKHHRFIENLKKARESGRKIEKWNEEVDKFADDPESLVNFPELEGKMEEFKVFASQERHAGIAFGILVPAFLHGQQEAPSKNKRREMFPTGSPGPDKTKKDNRLGLEESRKLRETDYPKWKRMMKAKKLKIDV